MIRSMPIRAAPYNHQQKAYTSALNTFYSGRSPGFALLMDMGTGKSLTATAIAGRLYMDRQISRVLVVAPLTICPTYNDRGKHECDSQQIPEDMLLQKCGEVGGIEKVSSISVSDRFTLIFNIQNGEIHEVKWEHPSRSKSWTPEMKEKARQKALERSAKCREEQ